MATATRRRGDVVLPVLALIPGALFLVTFVWRAGWDSAGARRFTLFDDAMISMAYARTLAETGEWVWFPGAGRVQGFTNPLWTLWMAVLHTLGLHDSAAALAVSATGVVLLIGTALLAARLVRIALGEWRWGPLASAVAAGTVPFVYPLAFWTLRGMEVGLLAALSLVMAWGLVASLRRWSDGRVPTRSLVVAALAGALGVLTRLDFAVVAVVLLACALLWAPDGRQRMRVLLFAVLPVAVAVVAVLVVQQAYWGDWLTNTYRLKMEGFGLLDRLPRGLASAGKALPLLTITVLGLVATLGFASDRVVRRAAVALTSVVGATAAYSVWVGGDAWEWSAMVNRYLSVGLPAALVVTFVGAGHFLERASTGSARQLVPALIVIMASGVGYGVLTNPLDLSASNMNTEVFLLLLVSLLLWCAAQLFVRLPDSFARALLALVCVGLVFATATSALPGRDWIDTAGTHVDDDRVMTARAEELPAVTTPEAVIATVWAGAPGYYSNRPMVDLLGKSDRTVATGPPAASQAGDGEAAFLPGHNKWDYAYSIGTLRPDVVFQLWEPSDADLQHLAEWGYIRRCLTDGSGSYFLQDSTRIRWESLSPCPSADPTS